MSNMKIEVELLAGTSIEEAAKEAKIKAIQWDVAYVAFSFNDVRISVGQHADLDYIIDEYNKRTPYIVAR